MIKQNKNPWDQKPDESPMSFARFQKYLKTTPEKRNLRKLSEEIGISYKSVCGLSSKHKWSDRALAFDTRNLGDAITAGFKNRADQQKEFYDSTIFTSKRLIKMADKCFAEMEKNDEPLSPSMAVRLYEIAYKLWAVGAQIGTAKTDVETAITTLLDAGYLPPELIDQMVLNIEEMRVKNQNLFQETTAKTANLLEVIPHES